MIHPNDIGIVLLAAGQSHRFGAADKLLAPLRGAPIITHVMRVIAEFASARKVAICHSPEVADLLEKAGFDVLMNSDPARGLSSSLAIGAHACSDLPAMMVCLADMPFVSLSHLRMLAAACDAEVAPIVCSTNGSARMPPAIFARSAYGQLGRGEHDAGARDLLADALAITAPRGELADIDRPEDIPD